MITVNRQLLSAALDRCSKIASQKSTMAVIQHALIQCDGETLKYRATNLRHEVSGSIQAEGKGSFTISPRELSSAISALSGETVTLKPVAGKIQVTGDTKRSFKLPTLEPADFPEELLVGSTTVRLDADQLAELVATVISSARQDNDRPEQSRVRVLRRGEVLRSVATDGHRMAMRDLNTTIDLSLDIPLDVARMLSDLENGTVSIMSDARGMSFELGGERISALCPSGEFPPVDEQFANIRCDNSVTVSVDKLLDCLKAVLRVDSEHDLRLGFTPGSIAVECSGHGDASDEIEVDSVCEGEVWLNGQYVVDAITSVAGEVTLGFGKEPLDPFVISQPGWRTVIMPLRPDQVASRKGKGK